MNRWPVMLMIGALLPAMAGAAEVYKWVDEQGNVHFGDRPQGAEVERVQIRNASPDAQSQQRIQQLIESQEAGRQQREQDKQAQEERASQQAAAERHAEYCKQVRKNLETLKIGGRIYKSKTNGDRHYFSSEEMAAEIERLEATIAERCQ